MLQMPSAELAPDAAIEALIESSSVDSGFCQGMRKRGLDADAGLLDLDRGDS